MEEPKLLRAVRPWAIFIGAGAIGALQAMKWELLTFPEDAKIIMGWVFSIVTVFCVFFSGSGHIKVVPEINDVLRRLKDIRAKEERINEKQKQDEAS